MKHIEQQTHYELLEVPVTASTDQILDAYARAMETYAPDSIAVYTLVDPEQLESLRQRLAQALDTLSELEKRLAYDRQIGVSRTDEELARLRAEHLKQAAGAEAGPSTVEAKPTPAAEPVAAEPVAVETKPAPVAEPVAEEPPAAEAKPTPVAEPVAAEPAAAEAQLGEAEPVEVEAITEVEPISASDAPEAQASAAVAPATEEAPPAEPSAKVETAPAPSAETPPAPAEPPATPEPAPATSSEPAVAAKPATPSPALTPLPGGIKPAAHSRPMSPVSRRGPAVPPPLPTRSSVRPIVSSASEKRSPLRAPIASAQPLEDAPVLSQASAIATAESALAQVAKVRDSRTRLKTVVDIPSDAEFNGELLRRVREGRNMTLHVLAERTRISSKHMENIEADRYDTLPAAVYLRGMLMSIARELGLDPLRVSRSYMGLVASHEKKKH